MSVTIQDIANRMGVSRSTVAHVLGNRADEQRISRKTKERALRVARELNYRPNPLARQLRRGISDTVGLVIRDFSNPFFCHIVEAMQKEGARHGLSIYAASSQAGGDGRKATVEAVLDRAVDGLVSMAVGFEGWQECFAQLWRQRVPCVIVGEPYGDDMPCDSVLVKYDLAAKMALEHLYSLRHERFIYVGAGSKQDSEGGRDRAIKEFMRKYELPAENMKTLYVNSNDVEEGLYAGQQILKMNPRPTAIFAMNDVLAVGIIRAVKAAGLSVPGDISVVGCDNIGLAQFLETPLTTISWPYEEVARLCIRQILARRKNKDWMDPLHHELEAEFVVRQSTGINPEC